MSQRITGISRPPERPRGPATQLAGVRWIPPPEVGVIHHVRVGEHELIRLTGTGWRRFATDPRLWLLPWERPCGELRSTGDPVRWRLVLAVLLMFPVFYSAYQLSLGLSLTWLWALPLLIASSLAGIWFALTVITLPVRPVWGSAAAEKALARGYRRQERWMAKREHQSERTS